MKTKLPIIMILPLLLLSLVTAIATAYTPHTGDHFSYYETQNLGSGTGDYEGYTEQTIVNGMETINGVNPDGNVAASFSYSYTFSNSTGHTETGNSSGDFTFSPTTFLYINGTDDQTGYVNPTVWFVMDNTLPIGNTFTILNTDMTVMSKNYSYYLPSQGNYVATIFAEGDSSYQRDDVYGQFSATYTWQVYFDPATGYIVGYTYTEYDTNASGTGFTYTENLYVNSTSYPLTTTSAPSPSIFVTTSPIQTFYFAPFAILFFFIIILLIIVIIIYAVSRSSRKRLPRHSYQQPYQPAPPPPPPQPDNIDLTPKQPAVQQVVIKEVVKVKCRYCGALIDSTAEVCPICGAPRT